MINALHHSEETAPKTAGNMQNLLLNALVLCACLALPAKSRAEGVYIGFIFSAVSKGGITLGYRFDAQNSVEFHFNGVPHVFSYGTFLKHYANESNRDYVLLGYTQLNWAGNTPEPSTSHGINLGYGYRFGSDHAHCSYPVEIGGGPGYDFSNNKIVPQFFVGGGFLYGETPAKN